MERNFKAKLSALKKIAVNTYQANFRFETDTFEFTAGQYVWINHPKLLFDDPRGSRRAFSISSSPNTKGSIEIIFRGSDSGFKKTLIDKRSLGESVEIIGPFGFMGIPNSTGQDLVFISGGVGVAPLVSMLRYVAENKLKNRITLIQSNSKQETSFYIKLFRDLETRNKNFKFVDSIGRLDIPAIEKNVSNIKNNLYYVLGPKDFVTDTSSKVSSLGVPKENFVFDEFYGFPSENNEEVTSTQEAKEGEFALQEFRTAVVNVADHIIITDVDGFIRYANPAAEKITGYSFEEMKGNTPRLWGGLMDKTVYENMWKTIKADKKIFEGEITNRKKTGETYYVIVRISPVLDSRDRLTGFVGTEEDITKIKELDKTKDEFLSMASHEIRTPLSIIDGIVSMLKEEVYGKINKNVKSALDDVNESSTRLINLVNDLLSVSRMQAGRLKYNISTFDITIPVKNVYDLFKPAATEKGLKINISKNAAIKVQADKDKAVEVLTNIISNCFKFTQKGGIDIKISREGQLAKISVSDTGVGIDKSDQELLFGKFQQVGEQKNAPKGTGLGLHISREMIKKMGGDMWLESSEPGKGSTFSFSLPIEGSAQAKSAKEGIEKEATEHPDQKSDTIKGE